MELKNEGYLEGLFKKLGCLELLMELRMLNFVAILLSIETGVPNFMKLFGNDKIYVCWEVEPAPFLEKLLIIAARSSFFETYYFGCISLSEGELLLESDKILLFDVYLSDTKSLFCKIYLCFIASFILSFSSFYAFKLDNVLFIPKILLVMPLDLSCSILSL
jgi:hypothetical protein